MQKETVQEYMGNPNREMHAYVRGMLYFISENVYKDATRIVQFEARVQWQAFVKMVMDFQV